MFLHAKTDTYTTGANGRNEAEMFIRSGSRAGIRNGLDRVMWKHEYDPIQAGPLDNRNKS